MKEINKDGLILKYKIIVKNNKHTYIRVKNDGIHITTNKYYSLKKIEEYLLKNFEYYYQKYLALQVEDELNEITLENKKYQIVWYQSNNFKYELIDNNCYIYSKNIDKKYLILIYEHYLKKVMLPQIYNDILLTVKKDNVLEKKIIFKYLKSKYGSYHKRGDYIVINTYLAKLDINYLKYVIYHEYAHVIHFNHSKKFYHLIFKWMPDYQKYHKKINKHSIIY